MASVLLRCKVCGESLKYDENKPTCTCEYCNTTQSIPHFEDSRVLNAKLDESLKRQEELINDISKANDITLERQEEINRLTEEKQLKLEERQKEIDEYTLAINKQQELLNSSIEDLYLKNKIQEEINRLAKEKQEVLEEKEKEDRELTLKINESQTKLNEAVSKIERQIEIDRLKREKEKVKEIEEKQIHKIELYNRAIELRLHNEFDDAKVVYENIIEEYPLEYEAYWGLLLCKYGIEYVDDPRTFSRVPTCHRTQLKSIFDDVDYKLLKTYASNEAFMTFENEAKTIDFINKRILAISQKEEPYDIFISYKESDDETRKRTDDSKVGRAIYDALTNKGYKVFYSRVTLEDKLGSQYEPYIFAALRSAKVMLVLGSKKEYFDAIWVKNEWSRYLNFLNESKEKKYIIPCYFSIAEDLPKELSIFQALDIDMDGYLDVILSNIERMIGKKENESVENNVTNSQTNINGLDSILSRLKMELDLNNFDEATNIINNYVNTNPNDARAYVLLFVAEHKLKSEDDINNLTFDIKEDKNIKRAMYLADESYLQVINGYCNQININIKQPIYDKAIKLKEEKNYDEAINFFKSIIDYNDSNIQIEDCSYLKNEEKYLHAKSLINEKKYLDAIECFNLIINFKDSTKQIEDCKEQIYYNALQLKINKKYDEVIKEFKTIIYFKDSKEQINNIETSRQHYEKGLSYKQQLSFDEAIKEFKESNDYLDSSELIKECYYTHGLLYINNKEYEKALKCLNCCPDYKNAKQYINNCSDIIKIKDKILGYKDALKSLSNNKYNEAIDKFKNCIDYLDSKEKIKQIEEFLEENYNNAKVLIDSNQYDDAIKILNYLELYKDSESLIEYCNKGKQYLKAIQLYNEKEYDEAIKIFNTILDFKDSKEFIENYSELKMYPVKGSTIFEFGKYNDKVIQWDVLDVEDDKALIVSHEAVDVKKFNEKRKFLKAENNYETSDIRKWLNEDFYKEAFTYEEGNNILLTTVDNSEASCNTYQDKNYFNSGKNKFVCHSTLDKVFLLSLSEATNPNYGFDPKPDTENKNRKKKYTYSLRSPSYISSDKICIIDSSGKSSNDWHIANELAINPAMWIQIDQKAKNFYSKSDKFINKEILNISQAINKFKPLNIQNTDTDELNNFILDNEDKYITALSLYLLKNYTKSLNVFKQIETYKDSKDYINILTPKKGVIFKFGKYPQSSDTPEPIEWDVLDVVDGKVLLFAHKVLDAHKFDKKSKNYANSEIRAWLNNEFLNKAFTKEEQDRILVTEVDNSERSTNPYNIERIGANVWKNLWKDGKNKFACDNTYDKIFLLSVYEITNPNYDYAEDSHTDDIDRMKQVTEYAKKNNALFYGKYSAHTHNEYKGNGQFFLRSPVSCLDPIAFSIDERGEVDDWTRHVYDFSTGVAPALWIKI